MTRSLVSTFYTLPNQYSPSSHLSYRIDDGVVYRLVLKEPLFYLTITPKPWINDGGNSVYQREAVNGTFKREDELWAAGQVG